MRLCTVIQNYINPEIKNFENIETLEDFLATVFTPASKQKFIEFIKLLINEINDLDKNSFNIFYEDNVFIFFLHGYQLVKVENNVITVMSDLHAFTFEQSQEIIELLDLENKKKFMDISENIVEINLNTAIFEEDNIDDFKDSVFYLITELFIKPVELKINTTKNLISYFDSNYVVADKDNNLTKTDNALNSSDSLIIKNLIELDEQYNVEFKAAFFDPKLKLIYDKNIEEFNEVKNSQTNEHTNIVLETINAFLNYTTPCYLLVGVADCGCCVGIENDIKNAQRNIQNHRAYEETIFNLISSTMGVVAASNIKLDFINISPEDSQKINYPNGCKLDKPYMKFNKDLHRLEIDKTVTVGLITTYPSKTPVFFTPLAQELDKKYMAKKLFFTRAGSSDRNNDFEETVQQIKNRYPDYL